MSDIELVGKCIMGIETIDKQHHFLVKLLNEFHDAIIEKKPDEEMKLLINGLFEYATTHFSDEEEIMTAASYPKLEAHKEVHRNFVRNLQDIYQKYENSKFLRFKFFNLLMDLLLNHIENDDYAFSTYYKSIQE